ncbi:ferric/cupric-chelate reductase [Thoreauomyces humboldtii]|nr:ferric/cupric-chelate reductase [Thoreauomyces humboldtii]
MSKPDPRMLLVVLQSCYKAIGIPIGIQLSLTLLPTSRGGFLSSIFGIGYDHSLGFHRLSGILTVLLAIAHFAFFMAFSVVRGGWAPFWRVTLMIKATPQAFASYKGWHGPTGLVSLLLFVWVFCNSSEGTRRRSYCWFMINHFSVLGAILLAFVHASPIVWFCFPTLSFYIVDSCARVYNRRRPHAITRMSVEECGYIRLDIGDCHTTARPGQWVALNVPSISGIEWHPFTVAHSTSTAAGAAAKLRSKPEESQYLLESPLLPSSIEHPTAPRGLSLIIRPAFADASWTQKLLTAWTKLQAEDVEAGGVRTLAVHVDGPHGTLPPRFLRSDTILIIVGGSGIPGALAIARAVLDANPATGPKRLILHWTCRSPGAGEMTLWRELLAHPRASQLLESHVCVTTGKKHSPRLSVPSILRSLCDEHPSAPLPCRNVSIYGCGPEELMSDIRRHVSRFGDVVGDGFETTLEGPYAEVEARATTVDPGRDEPWVDREPSSASSTLSAPEVERVRSSRTRSSSPSPSRNLKIKFLLHVEGYGR